MKTLKEELDALDLPDDIHYIKLTPGLLAMLFEYFMHDAQATVDIEEISEIISDLAYEDVILTEDDYGVIVGDAYDSFDDGYESDHQELSDEG